MLSAVAFGLMFMEVPGPLMPTFCQDGRFRAARPAGSFSLGPWYGVAVAFLKNLITCCAPVPPAIWGVLQLRAGRHLLFSAGWIYHRHPPPQKPPGLVGASGRRSGHGGAQRAGELLHHLSHLRKFYGCPWTLSSACTSQILSSADGLLKCLVTFNMPFTFVKGLLDVDLLFDL
jgi:hypothetical protein